MTLAKVSNFVEIFEELKKDKTISINETITKTTKKLKINSPNRIETSSKVNELLDKKKIPYISKVVSGSSFPSTIILFEPKSNLKSVSIQYKSSNTKIPDAKTTSMQEKASVYVFERVLKDNKTWKSTEEMMRDTITMDGIKKVYPTVEFDWIEVFWKQHKKMFDEFSSSQWNIFDHSGSGSFMQYVNNIIVKKFGISKKDNWNPADMWLIKSSVKKITDLIDKTVEGSKETQTIEELNTVMRSLYKERKLVGISLKKISGQQAKYEEYNVDELTLDEKDEYNFPNVEIVIKLTENMTQDTIVKIRKNGGKGFKFQIKSNNSSIFSNLKWEATQIGSGAARSGKAQIEMVVKLLNDYGQIFDKTNSNYPKSIEEYNKRENEFTAMFNRIKTKVETGIANDKEFNKNIKATFFEKPHVANSKLMQIAFLDAIYKIPSKEKQSEVWTDIIFLSIKKGNKFGPFGKLY
jgi:hypothetical protein